MKKITLSEKIIDDLRGGGQLGLRIEDIKKSVKRLMKNINDKIDNENNVKIWTIFAEIKKEFGKDLV